MCTELIICAFVTIFLVAAGCLGCLFFLSRDNAMEQYDLSAVDARMINVGSIHGEIKGEFPPTPDGFDDMVRAVINAPKNAPDSALFPSREALRMIAENHARSADQQLVPVPPSEKKPYWSVASPRMYQVIEENERSEMAARYKLEEASK
jgi:hypothetical protein